MRLGSRNAKNHDTAMSRQAVQSELFADFQAGQRVKTIDGIMGTVAAIEDGPFPGTEAYRVDLDHGLGGGLYSTGQLTPVAERKTSEHHTAQDDYPELGSILYDRPNIAREGRRDPFVHEAWGGTRPDALGPSWIHRPPQQNYDREQFTHDDIERQHTHVVEKVSGGVGGGKWEGHIKNWCGHETRPSDIRREDPYHQYWNGGKFNPSSVGNAAHAATDVNLMNYADHHRREHHDAEGNCYHGIEGGRPDHVQPWEANPYGSRSERAAPGSATNGIPDYHRPWYK